MYKMLEMSCERLYYCTRFFWLFPSCRRCHPLRILSSCGLWHFKRSRRRFVMNFSEIFINCWRSKREKTRKMHYNCQTSTGKLLFWLEHTLKCELAQTTDHIHENTNSWDDSKKKVTRTLEKEEKRINMNFQQFKKLNYVTFYRHTFSYNLKLQLIIYDAGECLWIFSPSPHCVSSVQIFAGMLQFILFFCYIKCTPIHTHVMVFFHFTDVYPFFWHTIRWEQQRQKTHEKIFAVEKLKGNTLEYFTFYRWFLFVQLCLHFCLQSESECN